MRITLIMAHREVFGNKDGFKVMRSSSGPNVNGALAKAKIQAAKRRADKLAAQLAVADAIGENATHSKWLVVLRDSIF